jgi:hypothetical protein
MVPLPAFVLNGSIHALQQVPAHAVRWTFQLARVPVTRAGIVLSNPGLKIEAARSFALCIQGGFHHEPRRSTAVDWKGYLLRRLDRIGMWRLVSP